MIMMLKRTFISYIFTFKRTTLTRPHLACTGIHCDENKSKGEKKTNNFSSHRWYEGNEPRIKPIGLGQPNKICTDNETVLFTFKFKQFLSRNHNNNKKNGNSLLYVRFYYCFLTTIMHNKYLSVVYLRCVCNALSTKEVNLGIHTSVV